MSYDCSILFCIQVMYMLCICEPRSIRYTIKSLISYGKTANPEKIAQLFKEFYKNYAKMMFSYGGFNRL